jgi:CRISPR-associated protein Cas2
MAQETRHIVVSYDIHDPRRLLKVAKVMKDYGERVLRSVFECNLTDGEFHRMKERVEAVMDHMEDSTRFYFLCEKCIDKVGFSGVGQGFVEDEDVVIA